MERILDINVRSLYQRILSTKYDLDLRLLRYVDKMASITTLPSNPREPKQPFFPSDSYASRWIIQKGVPSYDAYRRQKWSIKSCIGHKCVCVYGVGCRIVALMSWYLYFPPDTPGRRRPRLVWRRKWNATESPRFVHSSRPAHRTRPRQHRGTGPRCTKLVRLWNRICIPRETTRCGDVVVYGAKIALFDAKLGFPSIDSGTK